MVRTATYRRFHRRLAVVFGIQLLLWTASGLYFAWTDLEEIHGDHLRGPAPVATLDSAWVSPAAALAQASDATPLLDLAVVTIDDRPHYRLQLEDGGTVLADVRTGEVRGELTRDEAQRLAAASFLPDARIEAVEYLESGDVGPHHEYRGGPLPAWRVSFDHASGTRVYVAAAGGEVVTHRNTGWRIFDFLWMLHTMDYLGRDDINNPVLRVAAILAIAVVASGFVLWIVTDPRLRRRARMK